GDSADGGVDRARSEAAAPLRGLARGRVWAVGDVLRRAVQAGQEWAREDRRSRADGRREERAEEIGGGGETDDGGGDALEGAREPRPLRFLLAQEGYESHVGADVVQEGIARKQGIAGHTGVSHTA